MHQATKDKIASKFLEHAVLHMLVRTLLFSATFRIVFVGVLLLPVLGALGFSRIWRVTPRHIQPSVRISALDGLQAWSLRRTALKELARGQIREGLISYNLSLGNNPGDLDTVRDFLRQIDQKVDAPDFQLPALGRAFWLLRLTQTNRVDLELAATIFEKYGLSQHVIDLLAPMENRLTLPLKKTYLLALFSSDRLDEFDRIWRGLEHSEIGSDLEIQLYRAAFVSGWSAPSQPETPGLRVDDFLDDPRWRLVANRLRLRVCEQRHQADEYWTTLGRLQEWGKDRLIDHVRGWRLLTAVDRQAEAVQRARDYPGAPVTGLETIQLVQSYYALGLRDSAKKLLDQFTIQFNFMDGLWVLYANLLIEAQEWDDLHRLALNIRLNQDVSERLGAYSYFLEGRVELAQHRSGNAARLFERLRNARIDNLELVLVMARSLRELGHAEIAGSLLLSVEKIGRPHSNYWESLMATAFVVKDSDLLLRAATEALALSPGSWTARNNYAAALVTNRTNPEESIRQTFQLLSQLPENLPVRLNHALALIQNHRYDEADRLLAAIPSSALDESERTLYNLACFETLLGQKRYDLARQFLPQIDARHLFSKQREHLLRLRERLPNPAEPKPARMAVNGIGP
jgi:tetratricopeptide (TPR) repeat protein